MSWNDLPHILKESIPLHRSKNNYFSSLDYEYMSLYEYCYILIYKLLQPFSYMHDISTFFSWDTCISEIVIFVLYFQGGFKIGFVLCC